MSTPFKIAGACVSAAALVACGGPGSGIFPTTNTSSTSLRTAVSESVLYGFKGLSRRDGQEPYAGLTAANGVLYGTTAQGGAGQGGAAKGCKYSGCGTVYRVSPSGGERVLHRFKGTPDGAFPSANLVSVDGGLYGTTGGGGENGAGSVFAIDPNTGAESVIYSFKGQAAGDGAAPQANLIAVDGVLYGTTSQGGSAKCNNLNTHGCGIAFSVTTSGTEQVLHVFEGGGANKKRDGGYPSSGLTAMNGLLYGTTTGGGRYAGSCNEGCGTVFEMSPSGDRYRVLYRFKGGNDGVAPNASLVNANGKLYGTTSGGGGSVCVATGFGCGTVFEVSASGRQRVLHRFHGSDGAGPNGLVPVNGTLYGTTTAGGEPGCQGYGCGTVFEIGAPGRGYGILHEFRGAPDGINPRGGLIYLDGVLYGATESGGRVGQPPRCPYGCLGTVFAVTP